MVKTIVFICAAVSLCAVIVSFGIEIINDIIETKNNNHEK